MEKYTSISTTKTENAMFSWKKVLGLSALKNIYSAVLEEEISETQTAHLVHVQLAALAMFILGNTGFFAAMMGTCWFAYSLWLCRLALKNK